MKHSSILEKLASRHLTPLSILYSAAIQALFPSNTHQPMCGYTHNAHTELKQSNYIQTAKHIILLLNTNKWLVCTNSDWSLTALCPWHTERALLLLLVGILESDTGGTFFSRKCMLDLWIMCNIVIPTINQVRICCGKGCDDLLAEHWYRPIFTLLTAAGLLRNEMTITDSSGRC